MRTVTPGKFLSISSGKAQRGIITQLRLAGQLELEEALDLAAEEATRGRWVIQDALENGAGVEPGSIFQPIRCASSAL